MCTRSVVLISLEALESNLVALARNSLITSLYDTHPRPSSLMKPPPRTSHFVVSTPSVVEERLLPLLHHPNPNYYGFLNCLILQCAARTKWHALDANTRDTRHDFAARRLMRIKRYNLLFQMSYTCSTRAVPRSCAHRWTKQIKERL